MDLIPLLILVTVTYIVGIIVGRARLSHYYLLGYRHGHLNDTTILKEMHKDVLARYNIEIKEEE